jgi:hypothetical protein
MAATATTRRKTTAAKPVEPVEVVETEDEFEEMDEADIEETDEDESDGDEDDDLEELEEVEEEETTVTPTKTKATKAKATKAATTAKAPAIEYGSPWLAKYITDTTDDRYDARGIRMLLRKLAADGKLNRKVGEDRNRYSFTGPDDETVKQVLAMVKDGTAKALKQQGLDKVKEQAAIKKAAAKAAKEAKEAEAAEVEETDEEEIEEVEEAPKPAPRRRPSATKTATPAPAKATPSTVRRKPAAAAK